MKKLGIYIPSCGRAEKQRTLKCLPPWYFEAGLVHLVVPAAEYDIYFEKNPSVDIMAVDVSGIAPTRQVIMEIAKEHYVLMLDDDMTFNARRDGGLKVATVEEVMSMLNLLHHWLDSGFAHVGISARQGNNHVEEDYVDVSRFNNAYAFNVDEFHRVGARFDRLPVMEDFDVTLTLLEAGLPNRVTFRYAWGQAASGEAGGCSGYRNDAMQEFAAFKLKELHPHSVKVVKKVSKQAWGGFSAAARYDVIIEWKKAYVPAKLTGTFGRFFG